MNILSILDGTPEPPIIDLHLENVNDSGEYNLATPMYEFQKELTDQIVSLHYPDILKYCETNDTRDLIIKLLQICIDNCMLVSTHPYLLISHYMPKNLALKDMLAKLVETSGKFQVARDLGNVIIQNRTLKNTKNVGVVMHNHPRAFDLAEALFLGCSGNKSIRRYVGNYLKKELAKAARSAGSDNYGTVFHLLPHDGDVSKHEEELAAAKFDVLVVFDSHVDTSTSFFEGLRSQNRRGEAIVIRLIPMSAIEHCQLYYRHQQLLPHYLYKLISSIVCLRDQIGNLPPDIFPIYNQRLTYLSHTFFDSVFKGSNRGLRFPAWPLPELPSIPRFSATDVERSLLTEVQFHYTPYDTAGNVIDTSPDAKKRAPKLYYESKRLELDYVTNPLKNDLQTLIGINNSAHKSSADYDRMFLTHRLLMELNNAYTQLQHVTDEVQAHGDFNEEERQGRIGRRENDTKTTLANVIGDVDHVEQRIEVAEKQTLKKTLETEELSQKLASLETQIADFAAQNGFNESNNVRAIFVANQLRVWAAEERVRAGLAKISSKNDEKNYMTKEYVNAKEAATESQAQVDEQRQIQQDLKRKIAAAVDAQEDEDRNFKMQRSVMKKRISVATEKNDTLRKKLGKSLRFLNDTAHLKKRKGRGLTPNTK